MKIHLSWSVNWDSKVLHPKLSQVSEWVSEWSRLFLYPTFFHCNFKFNFIALKDFNWNPQVSDFTEYINEGFPFEISLNFNSRTSILFCNFSFLFITLSLFSSPPTSIWRTFLNFFHFLYYCIVDAKNLKRVTGPYSTKSAYSNFNMTIRKHIGADPPLTVEFVGYSSNHNEKHSRSSANIAPYRTKSSRPVRYEIISNYIKWQDVILFDIILLHMGVRATHNGVIWYRILSYNVVRIQWLLPSPKSHTINFLLFFCFI